jgi:hypothetical protein
MKPIAGVGLGSIAVAATLMLATAHAHDPITTRVTWNGEIARIVEARCVTCHSPEGRGPMSLATYEDARKWAKAIKEEVMTRRMPYWQAVRGYGDFANDPSLSSFEVALVVAWADGGAPRGDTKQEPRSIEAEADASRKKPTPSRSGLQSVALPCGERPLPQGTLVALQPQLEKDDSVGMVLRFPDGRREIVGWIRKFDPEFPATYWLRSPLSIPAGTTLTSEFQPKRAGNEAPREHCTINVSLAAPR